MGVLRDKVDAGVGYAANARTQMLWAKTHLKNAGTHIAAQEWVEARVDLDNCANNLGSVASYAWYTNWATNSMVTQWRNALYWIDDNWPIANGNGVTMDAILTAMISADPDEFRKFIGIVDGYRVALWDAPFNENYYAALAQGFKEQSAW